MELKPLEIKITSLGDRSPGDLRAEVKFQVNGGPEYVIKAVRVDAREPFINHLISHVEGLPTESSGEDTSEGEPADKPRAKKAVSVTASAQAQETQQTQQGATAMGDWASELEPPSTTSHLLIADVLGFSRLVSNLEHGELDQRLNRWVNLVDEIRVETGIQHSRLISDTIFVRDDDSADGLRRLLRYSKALLERGLANHFPIRGAITKGPLTWGTLTHGKAVIHGHELERQQDWIGIACEPTLTHVPWSWDLVCCYPVPKKSGRLELGPAVAWNVPASHDLIRQCIGKGLMQPHEAFTWELHSKLANTLAFAQYVNSAKGHGADPEEYDGRFSPGPV